MAKKGISLIVLVITIIVVIILAAAVVVSLSDNNPFDSARQAVFKNDLDSFRTDLELYHKSEFVNKSGNYDQNSLQANTDEIGNYIDNLKDNKKYKGKLEIENGKLVFLCTGTKEDGWAEDIGVMVKCIDMNIDGPYPSIVTKGNKVEYWITFTSDYEISSVIKENIKLTDEQNNPVVSTVNVFDIEGKDAKKVEKKIEVDTQNLVENKNYKIKVEKETVTNIKNAKNTKEVYSQTFQVNSSNTGTPVIKANPKEWTNGDVEITIDYSPDSTKKLYANFDIANFTSYTGSYKVGNNGYIYAIESLNGKDITNRHEITNIDKEAPSAPIANFNGYTSNTWTNQDITINLNATDNLSGIKKYQFSTDNANWTDVGSSYVINTDTSYTITYRAIDNAGNISQNSPSYVLKCDKTAPVNTTSEVKNITSTGYDVYVYGVTDSLSGVNRVQFPTWTEANGQNDIQPNWETNSTATGVNQGNGTWYYRVNTSAHDSISGNYITHAYIYDNSNNIKQIILNESTGGIVYIPVYVTQYRYRDYTCSGPTCIASSCNSCYVLTNSCCVSNSEYWGCPQCTGCWEYCSTYITSCDKCGSSCTKRETIWCGWSSWSTTPAISTATREVETQLVPVT